MSCLTKASIILAAQSSDAFTTSRQAEYKEGYNLRRKKEDTARQDHNQAKSESHWDHVIDALGCGPYGCASRVEKKAMDEERLANMEDAERKKACSLANCSQQARALANGDSGNSSGNSGYSGDSEVLATAALSNEAASATASNKNSLHPSRGCSQQSEDDCSQQSSTTSKKGKDTTTAVKESKKDDMKSAKDKCCEKSSLMGGGPVMGENDIEEEARQSEKIAEIERKLAEADAKYWKEHPEEFEEEQEMIRLESVQLDQENIKKKIKKKVSTQDPEYIERVERLRKRLLTTGH